MAAEIITDNEAWKRAWRTRCCPPDHVMAETSAELDRHCAICPWCREEMLDGLAKHFEKYLSESLEPAVPCPGDICAVRPELSGWWEKGRYYNAPLILVLDLLDGARVSVLQVYDDPCFANADDIMLGPEISGFAEPWNHYTLDSRDLAYTLARVSPGVLAAARAVPSNSGLPIAEGSLLWFFRNMEVETGFFFAGKHILQQKEMPLSAVSPQMDAAESQWPVAIWRRELNRLNLLSAGVPIHAALADLLGRAHLPDELLPLAAEDSHPSVTGLIFSWHGETLSVNPVSCTITTLDVLDSTLLVSGLVNGSPPTISQFICWWEEGGALHPPLPDRFGYHDGNFWAAFPLSSKGAVEDGRLLLRFLQKE